MPLGPNLQNLPTASSVDPVYKFNSIEHSDLKKDFCFIDCPLKNAVSDISQDFGVFVTYSEMLGDKLINGFFNQVTIRELLDAVALQVDSTLSFDGKVFYIGGNDRSSRFYMVGRSTAAEEDLQKLFTAFPFKDENRGLVAVGKKFVAYDTIDRLKMFSSAVMDFDDLKIKSYVAEVFFIKCSNSDLLDVQARFDATGIDILKQSWSMKDLFNCYVDGDLSHKKNNVLQRPILYLSEDKEAELEIGTDLTLEKKAISTEGYTSTTGWQQFSDGLKINMLLSRVRSDVYQIDFELSISKYGDVGDTVVGVLPQVDRTALKQSGVIVPAGEPVLLGSLATQEKKKGLGFISVRGESNQENVLVWLRVRELDISKKNIFQSGLDGF